MFKTKGSGTGGLKLKKSAKRRKEKTQQVYCLLGFSLFWCARGDLTSAAVEAESRGKRAPGTFSNTAPVQVPSLQKEISHPFG